MIERFIGYTTVNTIVAKCQTEKTVLFRIDCKKKPFDKESLDALADGLKSHSPNHKIIVKIQVRSDVDIDFDEWLDDVETW